jgi:hypothetical protein
MEIAMVLATTATESRKTRQAQGRRLDPIHNGALAKN